MTTRFYIVPIVGSGKPKIDPRRPAYFRRLRVDWSMMDYGLMPLGLVAANVDREIHAQITGQPDVIYAPLDIDQPIGRECNGVKRRLLDLRIPAGWLDADHTYREVLRTVAGCFQLSQAFHGAYHKRLLPERTPLSAQFRETPKDFRDELYALMWTAGTIIRSNHASLHQIFKSFAEAWHMETFHLGGFAL